MLTRKSVSNLVMVRANHIRLRIAAQKNGADCRLLAPSTTAIKRLGALKSTTVVSSARGWTDDQADSDVSIFHVPLFRDKRMGWPMTSIHAPGRCSLEITPEEAAAPRDNGAHERLTTPPQDPPDIVRMLQVIRAQLGTITATMDDICPRLQTAINAIMGEQAFDGVTMSDILQFTATHYRVTPREIRSRRRNTRLVRPRHVVMYLCKTMTPRSYPEIAMFVGGRDHTTVLHAVTSMTHMMDTDADFAKDMGLLTDRILTGGSNGYPDR
jgi:Bacterial dnaA protein helix-turn-helix